MAVHSKDGKTWLTKLKRIGELAATNAEIAFNNLGHIIDAANAKRTVPKVGWEESDWN
jgi:hypothetical protein